MMCWFLGKAVNATAASPLDGGKTCGMTGQGMVQQEGEGGRREGGGGRHGYMYFGYERQLLDKNVILVTNAN